MLEKPQTHDFVTIDNREGFASPVPVLIDKYINLEKALKASESTGKTL